MSVRVDLRNGKTNMFCAECRMTKMLRVLLGVSTSGKYFASELT